MDKSFYIIIIFIVLLFLSMILYLSYKVYNNRRQPTTIAANKFALFETQSKIPEGIKLISNPNSIQLLEEINEINNLQYCLTTQCVIDLSTGIKRCPGNNTSKLLYDQSKETCVMPTVCPEQLPFAVMSNGETNTLGQCEGGLACRCTSDVLCPYGIVNTIDLIDGTPFVSNKQSLNYSFVNGNNDLSEGFYVGNITINIDDISDKFCKINPVYTERIKGKCNFETAYGDPMDCNKKPYLILSNKALTYKVISKQNYDINNVGDIIPEISLFVYYDTTQDLPSESGILNPVTTDGNNYFITYNGFEITALRSKSSDKTVVGVILFKNLELNGDPGAWNAFAQNTVVILLNETFKGCSDTENNENYKNLLNCVQPANQPCSLGQLSYDVDRGNPRNFARLTTSLNNATTNDFLIDPVKYTMGCYAGGGCSKNLDLSLCTSITTEKIISITYVSSNHVIVRYTGTFLPEVDTFFSVFNVYGSGDYINETVNINITHKVSSVIVKENITSIGFDIPNNPTKNYTFTPTYPSYIMEGSQNSLASRDCIKSITNKKNNFYDKYDNSAVSNRWILSNNGNVIGEEFSLLNGIVIIDENNNLFEPETGDWWTIYSDKIYTNNTKIAKAGDIILYPNNIQYVSAGMFLSYSAENNVYTFTITIVNKNDKSITINSGLSEEMPLGQKLTIYTNISQTDFGTIGNVEKYGTSFHASFKDYNGDLKIDLTANNNIQVYKQYGFNGINYNTTIDIDNMERYYSESTYWKTFTSENITPPLCEFNVVSNNYTDKTYPFTSQYSTFKTDKSMYYPIWNTNTFKQECVMPYPNFNAFVVINNETNTVERAQIQFSGQHFGDYSWNLDGNYYYTTTSEIYPYSNLYTYQSTTISLILSKVNPNISIGDRIVDSQGIYLTNIILLPGQIFTLIPGDTSASFPLTILNLEFLEDKYKDTSTFTDSASIITTKDGKNFRFVERGENYIMGKIYIGEYNGMTYYFTIESDIVVTAIDGNLIQTNYNSIETFSGENRIQFLNKNQPLGVDARYDNITDNTESLGSESVIKVSGITNSRITNLTITNGGKNYLDSNLPNIIVSNFKLTKPTSNNIKYS